MPRRALRKIDPALDLAGRLRTWEDLPQPFSAAALFNRESGALEVEVGSGKGLFLASAAAAALERDFLGLEISRKYARFCAARLARLGLTNACVASADALRVFRELLPSGALAAVHVYFPDPWWKARHKKRRVINQPFLADVERTLQPDGALHFWTDVEEYFQTSLDLITRHTSLEGPLEVIASEPKDDLDYRTHFERRTRLGGQPVYRSEFRKRRL